MRNTTRWRFADKARMRKNASREWQSKGKEQNITHRLNVSIHRLL